jgi:DNA repair ATPase RecN
MKHIRKIYLFTFAVLSSFSPIASKQVQAAISLGELVDKITILTIKTERISDPEKLKNVTTELQLLQQLFNQYVGDRSDIAQLMKELKITNEQLWDIEDILRVKERIKEFNDEFIQLARNVYITNDKRCSLKRKIDTVLGSEILEEKSYEAYL